MADPTADARKQFNRWSRYYDRDPLQPLLFRPSHDMLLDSWRAEDRLVLDIGCGTAQFAARLASSLPRARVLGYDLSSLMLARGRGRCATLPDQVQFVQGDSERLPFPDSMFDVVTCTHSFHHYPRQRLVVDEMHRVLRPGGRAMIIDGDKDRWWGRLLFDGLVVFMEGPVRHLSARQLSKLLGQAGFTAIQQRRRGGPLPFLCTIGQTVKKRKAAG
jgi:ubiquinone/menaquinone biosynthesis C-methylase UbiE